MNRRVLLIAFQYPPMTGTSGIQRALRFSQYLPQFGWDPIVLTANPRAYERCSDDQMRDVPQSVPVSRAFALDAARHLSFRGRYPSALSIPDRWSSWWLSAVPEGLRLIRKFKPAAIWSTFPIPTAHRIGMTLRRLTGLPWVADFRDVMTEDGYPAERRLYEAWRALEGRFIASCSSAVFTTPGAAAMYAGRYPNKSSQTWAIVENGYDEDVFAAVERSMGDADVPKGKQRQLRIVHSGVIYPMERDPRALFEALGKLRKRSIIAPEGFLLRLRATGNDAYLRPLLEKNGIADIVELAPPLAYREAIKEMLEADGLLLMQGNSCNRQIPAKLYEYFRCRLPILGFADGDTASALKAAGVDTVAALEDSEAIEATFLRFWELLHNGVGHRMPAILVQGHSRRRKAGELGSILDRVTADRPKEARAARRHEAAKS